MKAKLRKYKFNSEGKKINFKERYSISDISLLIDRKKIIRKIEFTQEEIKNILEGNYKNIFEKINNHLIKNVKIPNQKGDIKLGLKTKLLNFGGEEEYPLFEIFIYNKKFKESILYAINPEEDNPEKLYLCSFADA